MLEVLRLRHQKYDEESRTVSGLIMADGTTMTSVDFEPDEQQEILTVNWPSKMVEATANFYQRKMTNPDYQDGSWNCHSFVADTMGWDVKWLFDGEPANMPYNTAVIRPDELQDYRPYAIIDAYGDLAHSMLGLPDPTKNLGVWGKGYDLRIASNSATLADYGPSIRAHTPPSILQAGELALMGTRLYDEVQPDAEDPY